MGVLAAVHYHPQRQSLMEKLALNKDAVVLVISTDGDTDVKHYREVVGKANTLWHLDHPIGTGPCKTGSKKSGEK
ncbi:hypothetical protein ACLK2A_15695 [Escherichia coli]